jgi:hypothetical protein
MCSAAACRSIIASPAFADAAIRIGSAVLELGPDSLQDYIFGNDLECLAQVIGDGTFQEMSHSLICLQKL